MNVKDIAFIFIQVLITSLTATTLIYANGARIRTTMGAGIH